MYLNHYTDQNDIHDDVYGPGNCCGIDFNYYGICGSSGSKKKIQHNKCHTDNMKIEDLHGHTSHV